MGNAILVRKGGIDVSDATAVSEQVLSGSSFFAGENDDLQEGTMPNRGAINQALNAGGIYTIPEGYHNGMGKVSATSLGSQTQGTATPTQVLSGQTAYVNGQKITGTMPNRGANNIVLPVNGNVVIPEGYHNGQGRVSQNLVTQGAYTNPVSSVGTNPTYIRIPQGYYGTNTVSGYPEIVYSLDMARSSGYALQSEVDHWKNSYYGMEQDRNNWMNVANSGQHYSYIFRQLYETRSEMFTEVFTIPFSKMIQIDVAARQHNENTMRARLTMFKADNVVQIIKAKYKDSDRNDIVGANNISDNYSEINYNTSYVYRCEWAPVISHIRFDISTSGITVTDVYDVYNGIPWHITLYMCARAI